MYQPTDSRHISSRYLCASPGISWLVCVVVWSAPGNGWLIGGWSAQGISCLLVVWSAPGISKLVEDWLAADISWLIS
jgi:hypothetical protein